MIFFDWRERKKWKKRFRNVQQMTSIVCELVVHAKIVEIAVFITGWELKYLDMKATDQNIAINMINDHSNESSLEEFCLPFIYF